VFTVLWDLLNK
ncbi:hypothetical protein E2320_010722, partial [Naja naja]